MRLSEISEELLTEEFVEGLLFGGLGYSGEKADVLLVLGSRKAREYRVPFAAGLYHEGRAGKMLITGGKCQPLYDMRPEHEVLLETAVSLGVPRGDILIEDRAMNTAENMRFTCEVLAREMPKCRSIILVTTAYHMQRAYLLAKRYLPRYDIIPAPVQAGSTQKDNWQLTEKGRQTAKKECMKLKHYAQQNWIDDIEIKAK